MRKAAVLLLTAAILLGVYTAVAVGGSSSDPLVSKSYIDGTYVPSVVQQAEERTGRSGETAYNSAAARLKSQAELFLARAGGAGYAATFQEQRFKRGDAVTVQTGSGILLLAGEAAVSFDSGVVIDVTLGSTVSSGAAMELNHRYLAGEDTVCNFTVTSDTAVLAPQGYYAVNKSGEVDYNELAGALNQLGLFRGSTTPFGQGYELELRPTRIQGLIMFLRLIGEEEAALAYKGTVPFTDVPEWCSGYVGYAVEKGYVMGYGGGFFGTQDRLTGQQYITFLMRVLGYRDEGDVTDFSYETAIAQARELGVITQGEEALLNEPDFLRAQMVYFSYYALSALQKGSASPLLNRLTGAGAVDSAAANAIMGAVTSNRLP